MAEIINLRRARKAKKRDDKEKRAAENRALIGLSKAQKEAAKAENKRQTEALDGHEREPAEDN